MKDMKKMEYTSDDQFSTTKYIIKIGYRIKGHVDVMDIIGALFGQTEGLLNDLELRELQKTGRIGRIKVNNNKKNGDSLGEILIPSSLDRVETAILAATIESVDRVGPCTAKMELAEIQDIREDKRKQIMDRAKSLLQEWDLKTPQAEEMGENILDDLRSGELIEYGPEKLPAGEDIDNANQIIIVEGIADVKGMMNAGFRNAIGTNGTHVPKTIIELSKKKSCIAFVDGDRGGHMILNELLTVADIDFVAIAPRGLMVEELTRKQIIKHLQSKKTKKEWLAEKKSSKRSKSRRKSHRSKKKQSKKRNSKKKNNYRNKKSSRNKKSRNYSKNKNRSKRRYKKNSRRSNRSKRSSRKPKPKAVDPKLKKMMKDVLASNEVIGLNQKNEQVFRVSNTNIINELNRVNNTTTLILDGVVTQRLLNQAAKKNIQTIFAVNKASKLKPPSNGKIDLRLFKDYIQ